MNQVTPWGKESVKVLEGLKVLNARESPGAEQDAGYRCDPERNTSPH